MGNRWLSPKASAGVAGGVYACGWRVASSCVCVCVRWRCVWWVVRECVCESVLVFCLKGWMEERQCIRTSYGHREGIQQREDRY